jgi:asparagine synthase (glutamine-hydrolysing)
MLVYDGRVQRKWFYYDLPYNGSTSSAGEDELGSELQDRLEKAVERQLVSDVPVGAFLSGGLDSSAIVAMMRQIRPAQKIDCFCVEFAEGMGSEGSLRDVPYARRVAQHLGVDLHEIVVEPDAISRLGEVVALLDEPQADPAPINALIIAEHARAMGIPVLLSGAGGDDVFSGYRRHWALRFEKYWSWLPAPALNVMERVADSVASGGGRGQSNAAMRRLAKMFSYAAHDDDRRLVSYFWWSTEKLRRSLYSAEFAASVSAADTAAPLLETLARIPQEHDPLQRMLYLEGKHFLADHNLNYTDRAGMAVGVEVRVPLLDLDMVQFAPRVPSRLKQKGRMGKALFKRAMEPYLPHDVIYRPKSGFGAPLRRWLRHELRPMVEDTLEPGSLQRRGIFNPAAVARLVRLDREGRVDGSYTIFALMCFELWCRRFLV